MRSVKKKTTRIHHTLIWNFEYHLTKIVDFNMQGLRDVLWRLKVNQ